MNHIMQAASIVLLLLLSPLGAQEAERSLFDNVVSTLKEKYHDEEFRKTELPAIVKLYRDRAHRAVTLKEQREVTQSLLSHIPASHLGLLSRQARDRLMDEVLSNPTPMLGFALVEYDGKHYAQSVYEGGPAEAAGLRQGDRIITVDGVLVDQSERLDWRSDDAYLPDPPVRALLCEEGETVRLQIERTWGNVREIEITARTYSAYEAAKASARVLEQDGKRIAYIHFWFIHVSGVASLLESKLEGDFADSDALVLDLRGRGGSAGATHLLLRLLEDQHESLNRPIVALINHHSRSAKDVIAYELRERGIARLVGERTAGAVIPASFADVGPDTVLMFPTMRLGNYTDQLEGVGVEPDIYVEEAGPYSGGADPILEAGVREAIRLAEVVSKSKRSDHASAKLAIRRKKPKTIAADPQSVRLTSASAILAKMVEGLGGESAMRSHTSRTSTGTIEIGGMITGTMKTIAAAPNLMRSTMELPGIGTIQMGYDGKTAWSDNPMQGCASNLEGAAAEEIVSEADFYRHLNYQKDFRVKLVGQTEFAGEDCYELKLTDKSDESRLLFINSHTFLIAGLRMTRQLPMVGEAVITLTNEEYKEFDGIKIVTRSRQAIGDIQEIVTTITDVSFAPIDRSVFKLPDNVKTLLNGKAR